MTDQISSPESPKWGSTTKLVVGLAAVILFGAMAFYFRALIGPVLLAFVLAFLIQPVAGKLHQWTRLPWRLVVGLVYLLVLAILASITTVAGFAIVQQAQSLIGFVQRFIETLPELLATLTTQQYVFGPFTFDLTQFDLAALAEQLLSTIRPILGQAGSILSKIASSAASVIGWTLFVFMVSYFLLSETSQVRQDLVRIEIPGYSTDIHKLGSKLSYTWNSFLRGQFILAVLVIFSYYIMLTILGARLTIVLALLAGAARFVPYVGPFIVWTTTFIVTFLQSSNYFGLEPFYYALLVVAACLILDQVFDNLISPKLMGQTLGVHPAGVLIAAWVATRFLGIIGLVLAAPVLATLNLVGRYILRKMFDLDPWPESEKPPAVVEMPWARTVKAISAWTQNTFQKWKTTRK